MLRVFTLDEDKEWDAIVRTFPMYDIYWTSGYVKAFMIHGDGIPLLFYYENNKNQKKPLRGINVVMKRDIALDSHFDNLLPRNTMFDFITPYGYGGWLIEGEDSFELFESYNNWCIENNIISEFVRYHPVLNNVIYSHDFYNTITLGNTIVMDLSSPEKIWDNISSKNRNMIRKAIKSDVKIYYGNNPEIFQTFRKIYNGTMDKDNAAKYYYFEDEFYDSIMNDLFNNAIVFYAVLNTEIIAASIILFSNKHLNYHLSGSIKKYQTFAPTNLLLYKVALWGYSNGFKTLHLGGGVGSKEDGLYKFKKSFNKNSDLCYCIGNKIYDEQKFNDLIKMRGNNIEDDKFFPLYRA